MNRIDRIDKTNMTRKRFNQTVKEVNKDTYNEAVTNFYSKQKLMEHLQLTGIPAHNTDDIIRLVAWIEELRYQTGVYNRIVLDQGRTCVHTIGSERKE